MSRGAKARWGSERTTGDSLEDTDIVLLDRLVAQMDPREDCEENDDEGGAERVGEERGTLDERVARASLDAGEDGPDNVEEEEARETKGGITGSRRQVLEAVDDDLVRRAASVELCRDRKSVV